MGLTIFPHIQTAYGGIFCRISSVSLNIVMDLKNVMSASFSDKGYRVERPISIKVSNFA